MPLAGMVVKYYKEQGLYKYDPAVTNAFLEKIQNRYEAKEISEPHFKQMRQIIRRLNEFYLTGTFRSVAALRGTQYILSSENERLVDMFVAHQVMRQIPGKMLYGRFANIFTILKIVDIERLRT